MPKTQAAAVAGPAGDRDRDPAPEVDGVDTRRCRRLNDAAVPDAGPVLYWMSREQRFEDNHALLYAQGLATKRGTALHVVFCLVPKFLDATLRHFDFMLRGLREVEEGLCAHDIPFHLKLGKAGVQVPAMCEELGITTVVCDMSPLRVPKAWAQEVSEACEGRKIPVVQLDAHNVVPVWCASDKQEVGARTIRKKIMNSLPVFLKDFPALQKHPHAPPKKEWPKKVDWDAAEKSLDIDRSVKPVDGVTPGGKAAKARLEDFCAKRLNLFENKRNDPNTDACSGLSPYYHFGQISAQRCALRVRTAAKQDKKLEKGCEGFIEESVVRRELSDNFCFYNEKYDVVEGAAGWAQLSLQVHEKDKREYIYSRKQLEEGATHDDLWNASQLQMVRQGKMHGFLRMYWAKKILEWSPSPREALATAIWLNDRYELDGRDPNGYVGCMWSICGTHDMGWAERPIFGKIRFMNYAGCKRKMNIPQFVGQFSGAEVGGSAGGGKEPPKKKKRQ